jgi:hypothetical protein
MKHADILEFAKNQGYDDISYIEKWRGYDVYEPLFDYEGVSIVGPPLIILVKGDTIRMSTVEESFEQLDGIK